MCKVPTILSNSNINQYLKKIHCIRRKKHIDFTINHNDFR